MVKNTNYNIKFQNVIWKNGRHINWDSCKLKLSKMIPNGIDTAFCNSTLHDLECAMRELLDPYTGTKEWYMNCPIGAFIVSECCHFIDMVSSCYTYDMMYDVYKGGKYYNQYQTEMLNRGVNKDFIEKEFDTLLDIMVKYFRGECNVKKNVHTDFEGCVYNSLDENKVKLNIIIKKEEA